MLGFVSGLLCWVVGLGSLGFECRELCFVVCYLIHWCVVGFIDRLAVVPNALGLLFYL